MTRSRAWPSGRGVGKASGGPRARRDAPLLATRGVRVSALGRKYDLLGYQLPVFQRNGLPSSGARWSEGLAAAAPLLAAGAPALGILSALDDPNRLISRCAHEPCTLESIPRAACWRRARLRGKPGMGAGRGQLRRASCGDSDRRIGSEWDQCARCAAFRRRGRGSVQPRCSFLFARGFFHGCHKAPRTAAA